MNGRLPSEQVVRFARNPRASSFGLPGRDPSDWVGAFLRIGWAESSEYSSARAISTSSASGSAKESSRSTRHGAPRLKRASPSSRATSPEAPLANGDIPTRNAFAPGPSSRTTSGSSPVFPGSRKAQPAPPERAGWEDRNKVPIGQLYLFDAERDAVQRYSRRNAHNSPQKLTPRRHAIAT